jgi:2',3'-cyclic-nucleotide 2'-phosphodiesterase/3'-nucleotidase
MSRGGVPILPEDELTVCVNSYRASGAGGYDMLAGLEVERDIERDVAELMIEYIERFKRIEVDGRRYLTVILPSTANKRRV